jgi:catechol 2,3-dioxygenase-like lactoylglutathione lyase family enzyme
MTVKRMDNVGIMVEDIDAAIEFFTELGHELEGRAPIEGGWADGVIGLRDMRVEIAMMRTPDGHSRLEISRFLAPPVVADHRSARRSWSQNYGLHTITYRGCEGFSLEVPVSEDLS